MNRETLKNMSDSDRTSKKYLFFFKASDGEYDKIDEQKKYITGLTNFLKINTDSNFEIYVRKNTPNEITKIFTKTFTNREEIEKEILYLKNRKSNYKNHQVALVEKGVVFRDVLSGKHSREKVLAIVARDYLHTTTYEIIKQTEKGFIFIYGLNNEAKLIFL